MNSELFNKSDVFDACKEKLEYYIGSFTSLKAVVGEEFFMALVFFE